MLVKTIAGFLLLTLGMPSTAVAQAPMAREVKVARTWIAPSKPLSIERDRSVGQHGVRLATTSATPTNSEPSQPFERNWARRHPAALGALIGAAGGALWGAAPCWKQVCGDGHGPLLLAFGAGLGAGIGAGVGFTISIANR